MSIEKLRKRDGRLVAFDPEKIAGAIWALSRGNLAKVALSRGQLKKYRAVFLEIAANFEKRFAIAGNAATPLSD